MRILVCCDVGITRISDTNVFRQMEAGSEQLPISDLIINNEKFIISGKDFKLLIKFLGSEQPSPAQQAIIHFKKTFHNIKILIFLAFWRDVEMHF